LCEPDRLKKAILPALCSVLAMALILASTLPGAYAWHTHAQQARNDFFGGTSEPQGDLSVSKTVENASGAALTAEQLEKRFEFKIVFSDGVDYPFCIVTPGGVSDEYQLTDGNLYLKHDETAIFENLPAGISYRAVETPEPGYVIQSDYHRGEITPSGVAASFVNTWTETISQGAVRLVTLKEVAGDAAEMDPDQSFDFKLFIDGQEAERFSLKAGASAEFTVTPGALYEFAEENYTEIGFETAITNGYGTAIGDEIRIVARNTYRPQTMREITGEKTWDLSQNPDAALPDQIVVTLLGNGGFAARATVKPDANGKWRWSFSVPKYDEDGSEIVYTIEERPVVGFTTEVNRYDLINKAIKPEEPPEDGDDDTPGGGEDEDPTNPPGEEEDASNPSEEGEAGDSSEDAGKTAGNDHATAPGDEEGDEHDPDTGDKGMPPAIYIACLLSGAALIVLAVLYRKTTNRRK
jgi:hypothetical protein